MAEIEFDQTLVMIRNPGEHDERCEASVVLIRAWTQCGCTDRGCQQGFDPVRAFLIETGSVQMTPVAVTPLPSPAPDPFGPGWTELGWTTDGQPDLPDPVWCPPTASWCFGCTEAARDCASHPTTDDQPDSTMEDNS